MNFWAVHLVRYSRSFLKWTKEELRQMEQRKKKSIAMQETLDPRDISGTLNVLKKGGRGCVSIEVCMDASIRELEVYAKKSQERLLKTANTNTDNIKTNRRCPWCNGYRRRKWTRRHEFKSWTKLIAFHIALIPFGKVWILLFSLKLWVSSGAD